MIKYDKLWETMKSKGITQYDLWKDEFKSCTNLVQLKTEVAQSPFLCGLSLS